MKRSLGLFRVATAVPFVKPADITNNYTESIKLAQQAEKQEVDCLVFPELSFTAYTCADLFVQGTLLKRAYQALDDYRAATASMDLTSIVGMPILQNSRLFNCAVVLRRGEILGVVPKTYLPGTREFYEPRWFTAADEAMDPYVDINGVDVEFGTDLLFSFNDCSETVFGVELCEDLWAPLPPSTFLALQGAKVIFNLSASNAVVGKSDYRRGLVQNQSAANICAYVYASAGTGESTTDLVFGGHCIIAENGRLLGENKRFQRKSDLLIKDLDIDYLQHERQANKTFSDCVGQHVSGSNPVRKVTLGELRREQPLVSVDRYVDSHPFVPGDKSRRVERCREIFAIQSHGLATRLQHTGVKNVVIGLSGGLDSTLALLVIREAFDLLGLEHKGIHCITMPGFGTTDRTLNNVMDLCKEMNADLKTVDIKKACNQHFDDIGHDGTTPDVTFENVQARERTQILMDYANLCGGFVVGTGDLSELALGWCTYNADHMSMYGVNGGVPKTLVKYLIEYVADEGDNEKIAEILRDILDTPISPELLPPDKDGNIAQKTEDVVGPYELHDFFLYYGIRCGFSAKKVNFLVNRAFSGKYDQETLKKWQKNFFTRFFRQQFKRSCLPDGPKVGTIALSPRGDWRMPSDASSIAWDDDFNSI